MTDSEEKNPEGGGEAYTPDTVLAGLSLLIAFYFFMLNVEFFVGYQAYAVRWWVFYLSIIVLIWFASQVVWKFWKKHGFLRYFSKELGPMKWVGILFLLVPICYLIFLGICSRASDFKGVSALATNNNSLFVYDGIENLGCNHLLSHIRFEPFRTRKLKILSKDFTKYDRIPKTVETLTIVKHNRQDYSWLKRLNGLHTVSVRHSSHGDSLVNVLTDVKSIKNIELSHVDGKLSLNKLLNPELSSLAIDDSNIFVDKKNLTVGSRLRQIRLRKVDSSVAQEILNKLVSLEKLALLDILDLETIHVEDIAVGDLTLSGMSLPVDLAKNYGHATHTYKLINTHPRMAVSFSKLGISKKAKIIKLLGGFNDFGSTMFPFVTELSLEKVPSDRGLSFLGVFPNLKILTIGGQGLSVDYSDIGNYCAKLERLVLFSPAQTPLDLRNIDWRNFPNLYDLQLHAKDHVMGLDEIPSDLKRLVIRSQGNLDLSFLTKQRELEKLVIDIPMHQAIISLQSLDSLTQLEDLTLKGTFNLGQFPFESLKNLKSLSLASNEVLSLSGIEWLQKLIKLDLSENINLVDFDNLRLLISLRELDLNSTRFQDLKLLRDLKNLHTIYLHNTKVRNFRYMPSNISEVSIGGYDPFPKN